MVSIPFLEFYITNVCNLQCRGCNRFNNYNFKGHFAWNDAYEEWAKKLDVEVISILGGEPTAHPQLEEWCINLRRLWPNSKIFVQSNGTLIKLRKMRLWEKYEVGTVISLHDRETAADIRNKWPHLTMDNGYIFHQAALIPDGDGFKPHESDPETAYNTCASKENITMLNGKLYRCPVVAILPEFQKQFNVKMDARQQAVLDSYTALPADSTDEEIKEFLKPRVLKQCEFCPSKLEWRYALGDDDSVVDPPGFS